MNTSDVERFEKALSQLESAYKEISLLAKKSPNDSVNAFKLRLINSTLGGMNEFFGDRYKPFPDFGVFSDDDIPSNSDVTFILSHYLEAAEIFRADHIRYIDYEWLWKTEDKGRIKTYPPRKLSKS